MEELNGNKDITNMKKEKLNLELSFNEIALVRRALIEYCASEKDIVLDDVKIMEDLVSELILLEMGERKPTGEVIEETSYRDLRTDTQN